MKEYTVRSFAKEFKVSMPTARRFLNGLVKKGKARTVQKRLRMMYYGKEIETVRSVTSYRLK